ncbi:hypothetical protein [Pseudomonas sp. 25571]|jgi:hypothetical protein|uniref:hypothetical protein n=1 Tax=Pseudomonas sp. 25571 TaxID=2967216 RepID=UPI0023643DCC|nr:hypothetical protein [Pseudomonas sp. 25571]MDD2062968.1 hypothetical protein [Pseudomonas sp. 25571]
MSNVTRLRHVLPLPADVVAATRASGTAHIKAIDTQGLLVAILHGHAHAETHRMVAR